MNESAGNIKKASREIEIVSEWNSIRTHIMRDLLEQKFSQSPYKEQLIATGDEYIQEGNYWGDSFWGVDLNKSPPVGKNILGILIMDIRTSLMNNVDLF